MSSMDNPLNQTVSVDTPITKRIAIIGSGVSGLVCAHYLVAKHEVTIFEANDYFGGHVNTIDIQLAEPKGSWIRRRKNQLLKKQSIEIEESSIDTGFIVFNERTYPNFLRLLTELDVSFQKTDMSFSVKNPFINFEYNGHTLNSLLSQRKNIISPKFWRFVQDIIRFNRHIKQLKQDYNALQNKQTAILALKVDTNSKRQLSKFNKQLLAIQTQMRHLSEQTLGDYLAGQNYGSLFAHNYLLPMVSAIWSIGLADAKVFPLIFFAQFFDNHGLLDIVNRPQWFTIVGGSKQYVNKLIKRYAQLGGKAYSNTPVQSVQRFADKVTVSFMDSSNVSDTLVSGTLTAQDFDEVIFACHADVAKRLLADINQQEQDVLGAFNFTDNQAVLHTDTRVLPNKPLAWASWNYLLPTQSQTFSGSKPVLTYHMNILQRLVKRHNYLVTLNQQIDNTHVIRQINYRHPVYDVPMTQAQQRWRSISGQRSQHGRTHFCGAYWFNGFHEDGVKSGLRVCQSLGVDVSILNTVNPQHLHNIEQPNPVFMYKYIPIKADKNRQDLSKRQVLKVQTNSQLNTVFNVENKG